MSLPFNSYNQLRYRGNEYVTDQTLNRTVYRLFQNDVYLDKTMQEHINNTSVHYSESDDTSIDYLTSDKSVILPSKNIGTNMYKETEDIITDGVYSEKTWQRLVDEQPRNIGGNTLAFRFQLSQSQSSNPVSQSTILVGATLRFSGFYGGTLIIESPAALNSSGYQTNETCINQRIVLTRNNGISIISIENCHCKVIVRNSAFLLRNLDNVVNLSVNPGISTEDDDFASKLNSDGSFNDSIFTPYVLYRNDDADGAGNEDKDGKNEIKMYSSRFEKWFDSNIISAINVSNSPDVTIKHCYIRY